MLLLCTLLRWEARGTPVSCLPVGNVSIAVSNDTALGRRAYRLGQHEARGVGCRSQACSFQRQQGRQLGRQQERQVWGLCMLHVLDSLKSSTARSGFPTRSLHTSWSGSTYAMGIPRSIIGTWTTINGSRHAEKILLGRRLRSLCTR
jgi:hypothetical protein